MNTWPRLPATVGLRTVFWGALLVNYGKITVLQNTVAQSIKYHIYSYIDNKFSLQFYFLFITHTLAGFCHIVNYT